MLRAFFASQDQVDLTQTTFDPNNAGHQADLKTRIDSFNGTVSALMYTDLIIVVPVTMSVLTWITGNCSLFMEFALLITCAVTLMGAGMLNKRVQQNKACQEMLHALLTIYNKCIADHGYQVTANENILNLLSTIAPYVETDKLWTVRAANPADYPAGFKRILSTPPHRVPFGEVKGEAASTLMTEISKWLGQSSPVQAVVQQRASGVLHLFRSVKADARQSIYAYVEKQATTLNRG